MGVARQASREAPRRFAGSKARDVEKKPYLKEIIAKLP
jgi:hypothetical protein